MEISRNYFSENLIKGNYSKEYVSEILLYTSKLSNSKLPVIYSTKHLSLLIGIEYIELKRIIGKRNSMYHFYQISKKNGGKREISVPHKQLKYIQNWIKKNILDKLEQDDNAHAYIKNKSILTNANSHLNSETILNIDLKKFFDSITEYRIFHLFKHLGYHSNLAVDLAKLCTSPISERYFDTFSEADKILFQNIYNNKIGTLPQGAPTSPSLSNLVCLRLDKRFYNYCYKNEVIYTRYSDDITFSGNKNNFPSLSLIEKIITQEKFFINENKVKYFNKGQKQMVTGLLIDKKIRVPKKFKKEIYRHLFFCKKFSPRIHFKYLSEKNGIEKGFQKDWLFGKIRYVYSIEPTEGVKMLKLFKEIKWEM